MARHIGLSPAQQVFQNNKNEEDFKSYTNQRINSLQLAIDQMAMRLAEIAAKNSRDNTSCHIDISHVQDACVSSIKDLRAEIDKFRIDIRHCLDACASLTEMVDESCVKKEQFDSKVNVAIEEFKRLNCIIEAVFARIDFIEFKFRGEIDYRLNDLKIEFMSKPSDSQELRKEFDEKIRVLHCHHENNNARASVFDKTLHRLDKKLEYALYMRNQEAK